MPKYIVSVETTAIYTATIEAKSRREAIAIAKRTPIEMEEGLPDFDWPTAEAKRVTEP